MEKPEDRFWSKARKTKDCWLFTGTTIRAYGRFRFDGVDYEAHRFSYELHNGKIQKGLVIDHLCRNSRCVNPDHLEAVTHRENTVRGNIHNKRKYKLPAGVYPNGSGFIVSKCFSSKKVNLGTYNTPEDASIVYQTAVAI